MLVKKGIFGKWGLLITAEFPQTETETDFKSKNKDMAARMVTVLTLQGNNQQTGGEEAESHSGQSATTS